MLKTTSDIQSCRRINGLLSLRAWKALIIMLINSLLLLFLLPYRRRWRRVTEKGGCISCSNYKEVGGAPAVDKEVAARRALAIKKVLQDDDNDDGTIDTAAAAARDFSLFVTSRDDIMFTQSWTPLSTRVRGLVVIMHGLNEHSSRYKDFAKQLNANGYKVYGMDWTVILKYLLSHKNVVIVFLTYEFSVKETCSDKERGLDTEHLVLNIFPIQMSLARSEASPDNFASRPINKDFTISLELRRPKEIKGHGGSDGLHAYVHALDHAVNDMKSFVGKVVAENPALPCFCFGHSTGAAIILKAVVLDPKFSSCISGVVLTSPAVGVQPSHPILAVVAPIISFLVPRYQLSAANERGIAVSRDPKALEAKYSDPLVFTGSIRVRTGYEILRITAFLQQNLNKLTVAFLVLHGTADTVTDPKASHKVYQEASSTDKSIKLYEGLLHDLLFEPEREVVLKDIID